MQADRAIGIGSWEAVFQVALDGAANFGQLRPDLVVPARQQFHFEQVVTLTGSNFTVPQLCLQPTLPRQVVDKGFILLFVFLEVVCEKGPVSGRRSAVGGCLGIIKWKIPLTADC